MGLLIFFHCRSLYGVMVSCEMKQVDNKLFTLGHKTRDNFDLYNNQYLCGAHGREYEKQVKKCLLDRNHIPIRTTPTPDESLCVVGKDKDESETIF